MQKQALLILADGFEEIEATAVIDILRRGDVGVTVAALANDGATGAHGLSILADARLEEVKNIDYDILILPGGGLGTENLAASQAVLTLIKDYKEKGKRIAAICAAPTVLAKAGVLDGVKVTSFPGTEDAFSPEYYSTEKVVTSGLFTTSRAPGTAIDFALELLRLLEGPEKQEKIGIQLVYIK